MCIILLVIIYKNFRIYIYNIYLVQRKPNFLQDKNVNLMFSRVHCENIVFPGKHRVFPGWLNKRCFHMIWHHLSRPCTQINQS